jgi:hypothetical protein
VAKLTPILPDFVSHKMNMYNYNSTKIPTASKHQKRQTNKKKKRENERKKMHGTDCKLYGRTDKETNV